MVRFNRIFMEFNKGNYCLIICSVTTQLVFSGKVYCKTSFGGTQYLDAMLIPKVLYILNFATYTSHQYALATFVSIHRCLPVS